MLKVVFKIVYHNLKVSYIPREIQVASTFNKAKQTQSCAFEWVGYSHHQHTLSFMALHSWRCNNQTPQKKEMAINEEI